MKFPISVPLKWLQAGWLLIALAYFLFYIVALQPMIDWFIRDSRMLFFEALSQLGMTPEGYGAIFLTLNLLVPMSSALVAGLIFWKRADDRMALLISLGLLTYAIQTGRPAIAFALSYPNLWWVSSLLRLINSVLLLTILCIFPSGRFVPRWSIFGSVAKSARFWKRADLRSEV